MVFQKIIALFKKIFKSPKETTTHESIQMNETSSDENSSVFILCDELIELRLSRSSINCSLYTQNEPETNIEIKEPLIIEDYYEYLYENKITA